ncbi:SecY-interacting protein Syd [Endozoicomonas euniceicola]|uniref:SecY-interacting protein Syd n=1 Tax=Endozoicomonas euniceicola TaxID=1234143 RepID=A0ABY6GY63_9GAMM|nr:SecY-interacting protein Syd [Endozoicomonas euniceicola]UYM17625.1 SecY-interacting protein Syd [Endozoicomonas euniceicola]
MNASHSNLISALQQFHHRYFQSYQQHHQPPTVEHDSDWPSACEQGAINSLEPAV